MTRLVLLLSVASAACAEPVIDVSLRWPTEDVDLSCVAAVRFRAYPEDVGALPDVECIVLDQPVTRFRDLQGAIRGRLELAVPISGLAAIEVAGTTLADCSGEAVFYGGAEYTGGDLSIPVVASLDCAAREDLEIKPVDFSAVAGGTCAAAPTELVPGIIHPTLLDAPLPSVIYDMGAAVVGAPADGVATLRDVLVPVDDGACLAVGDRITSSISCVKPGSPGACTTGAQVELTTVELAFGNASSDPELAQRHTQIVFGAVWTSAGPKQPIAGAEISVIDPDPGVVIRYLTRGGVALVERPGASATDATGLFVAYMDHPATVTITAPGHRARDVTLMGAEFVYSATAVVLAPE